MPPHDKGALNNAYTLLYNVALLTQNSEINSEQAKLVGILY